jgi:putative transcriptional regulator
VSTFVKPAFHSARSIMDPAIHNRVRELRQSRDWTQEHLAALAGVSRQSINSIERDRYIPSLPLALLLARIFQVPTDLIFTLQSEPGGGEPATPNPGSPEIPQ